MAAFPLFKSLPPELRCKVWEEALREEVEARTVIVHRVTMRVMPHPSTRSMIMNVNQESRHYAMNIFFDVHLDTAMILARCMEDFTAGTCNGGSRLPSGTSTCGQCFTTASNNS
ncbi:hypothetical protein PG990_004006 [Apiospora arundinis]